MSDDKIEIHWADETQLIGYGESDTTGPWIKFRVDSIDRFRGLKAERFYVTTVLLNNDGTPVVAAVSQEPKGKQYGKQAAALYACGLYFNPRVMEKVGTDQDYLDWLKTQPCCVRGSLIADKAHAGDIVPAHVRRIAAGAGTSLKPLYSAVPMCDGHHKLQHAHGESAVGGKDFFDHQRARHLSRWMAQTIFGKDSMGHVAPHDVNLWAKVNDIAQYLPQSYK